LVAKHPEFASLAVDVPPYLLSELEDVQSHGIVVNLSEVVTEALWSALATARRRQSTVTRAVSLVADSEHVNPVIRENLRVFAGGGLSRKKG
jgi:metal-responsive CopG/Arc/MetJ family transcriptional regulator